MSTVLEGSYTELKQAEEQIARLRAENERLRAVVDAARRMPRWTPKGGSASTMHIYQIKAADTWALDAALKALGGDEQHTQPAGATAVEDRGHVPAGNNKGGEPRPRSSEQKEP